MNEREELAAEYVLGLLEGQDLLTARGLTATDPAFAASVDDWEAKFAPLFDAITPIEPGGHVWRAIEAALDDLRAPEVVALRQRLRRWQIGAGVAAALAAAAAAIIVFVPGPGPTPIPIPLPVSQTPPLAATVVAKAGGNFTVVYRPDQRELVAIAPDMPTPKGHDLELWLLPEGSPPLPLGIMAGNGTKRIPVSPQIAARMGSGVTLAVSVEPVGGSPTGLPTGPVVATAKIYST